MHFIGSISIRCCIALVLVQLKKKSLCRQFPGVTADVVHVITQIKLSLWFRAAVQSCLSLGPPHTTPHPPLVWRCVFSDPHTLSFKSIHLSWEVVQPFLSESGRRAEGTTRQTDTAGCTAVTLFLLCSHRAAQVFIIKSQPHSTCPLGISPTNQQLFG